MKLNHFWHHSKHHINISLPVNNVGRASFLYLFGSSKSFPCHKLFHAKTTAITEGPSTIWFNKICKEIAMVSRLLICFVWTKSLLIKNKNKIKRGIPWSISSLQFAWACTDQDTDTMHKNQGHKKETHMKPSGGLLDYHDLKGEFPWHPTEAYFRKC